MAMPPTRKQVSLIDYLSKRLGSQTAGIGASFMGAAEGLSDKLGATRLQDFFGDAQYGLELTQERLGQEAGPYQTIYQGDDSVVSKAQRGELSLSDVGHAAYDVGSQLLPQMAVGGVAANVGKRVIGGVPGMLAGSMGSMAAQETGSIYNEQEEKDFDKAALLGGPAGMLEGAAALYGIGKMGIGKYVANELAPKAVRTAGQIGTDILKASAVEGATEFAQTGLEQIGARPGYDLVEDVKNLDTEHMIEGGLAGGLMGGMATGVSAPLTNRIASLQQAQKEALDEATAEHNARVAEINQAKTGDVATGVQPVSLKTEAPTLEEITRQEEDTAKEELVAAQTEATIANVQENAAVIEQGQIDSLPPIVRSAADAYGVKPTVFHQTVESIYKGAKNFQEFAVNLISQFGETIKRYALQLYNAYKSSPACE
jgi:hypothetical protein